MKKSIAILFVLLLIAGAAYARMTVIGVAGMVAASGSEDGCVTGATFTYNGDHSSGNTYACDSSGDSIAAAANTADSVSASYIEYNAVDEHLRWAIDASEIDDSTAWTIFFSVYFVDAGDTTVKVNALIETGPNAGAYDSSNHIRIQILAPGGNAQIYSAFKGQGTNVGLYDGLALSVDTWYRVGFSWSPATGTGAAASSVVALSNGENFDAESTSQDVLEWNSDPAYPAYLSLGEHRQQVDVNQTVRIADFVAVSGYKAEDPMY